MAGARRLSVFHRRIELGLSATALELVFAAPRVTSEGAADGERYVGSTTITIDLEALADRLSDLPDAATARQIAGLAGDDPRVRHRARQIAFDEAVRRAGGHLIQPEIDLRVKSQGAIVRFALDVEALVRKGVTA
ncbi:MAG: hypothetical protein IPL61_19915 [Myxococcales bacterium]|nr:hypothetical protein [Myxococcales bacterium]